MEYEEKSYWSERPNPAKEALEQDIAEYITNALCCSKNVLDYGAGVGRCMPAYSHLRRVEAFDIHSEYLKRLAKRAKEFGFNFGFKEGDIGRAPYPDKHFNAVLCCQVLLHQRPGNLEKVMDDLIRVAKRAIIVSANPAYLPDQEWSGHCFRHDYKAICEENGYPIKEVQFSKNGQKIMFQLY